MICGQPCCTHRLTEFSALPKRAASSVFVINFFIYYIPQNYQNFFTTKKNEIKNELVLFRKCSRLNVLNVLLMTFGRGGQGIPWKPICGSRIPSARQNRQGWQSVPRQPMPARRGCHQAGSYRRRVQVDAPRQPMQRVRMPSGRQNRQGWQGGTGQPIHGGRMPSGRQNRQGWQVVRGNRYTAAGCHQGGGYRQGGQVATMAADARRRDAIRREAITSAGKGQS